MRTRRLVAAAALLAVLAGGLVLWQVSNARCFALTGEAVCRVDTDKPLVALTFDDGPAALGVEAILPELERHGARATFFLIGREAQAHPELVARIRSAGHEIGNHTFNHVRMVARPRSLYDAEIGDAQRELSKTGPAPVSFRPPYGKKLWGAPVVVGASGLKMIMWDVEDPATADPQDFARRVVEEARPGSIILLHAMYPANQPAREALPAILAGLKAKGLTVVSAQELLAAAER